MCARHNHKWRSEVTLRCQPSPALLEPGSVLAFATVCTRLGWPALKLVSRDSPSSASPPHRSPGITNARHNHAWFYMSWWRVKLSPSDCTHTLLTEPSPQPLPGGLNANGNDSSNQGTPTECLLHTRALLEVPRVDQGAEETLMLG